MIILKILLFFILYLILFVLGLIVVLIVSPIKGYGMFDVTTVYFKGSYLFGALKIIYENKLMTIRLIGIRVYRGKASNKEETIEDESLTDVVEKKKKKKKEKQKSDRGLPSKRVIVLTLKLVKNSLKPLLQKKPI